MPVILPEDKFTIWLDPAEHDKDNLLLLLAPYPADELEAYKVTSKVNSVKNNQPDLIEPVP